MSDTLQDQPTSMTSKPRGGGLVRAVRIVGWTCIWIGLFLLGFVGHQLFVTTWLAQQNNNQLASEAEDYFSAAQVDTVAYTRPTIPDGGSSQGSGDTPPPGTPAPEAAMLLVEAPPPDGQPFAIIRIPSIERLRDGWTVVEGVTRSDLKNGAGHMPTTPLPGQPGNAVISGHRTTYGAPFHELDELEPGDLIEVETAIGVHTYAVRETVIVRPTELWVIQERPGAWLTLTTCHPKFSARQRLIVFAELVDGPNAEAIFG
ncbi:class E sortase [Actinomycetota bacterium]